MPCGCWTTWTPRGCRAFDRGRVQRPQHGHVPRAQRPAGLAPRPASLGVVLLAVGVRRVAGDRPAGRPAQPAEVQPQLDGHSRSRRDVARGGRSGRSRRTRFAAGGFWSLGTIDRLVKAGQDRLSRWSASTRRWWPCPTDRRCSSTSARRWTSFRCREPAGWGCGWPPTCSTTTG